MSDKLFFCLLIIAFTAFSCKTREGMHATAKPGMYKVTVFYPNGEGKTFDMDYYEHKHMPMVAGFIGKNLQFYTIDKGISGRTANEKPTYMAIGTFYIRDVAAYNDAIAKNRETIVNDFKNYTNVQPVVQVSEVVK